MKPGRCALPSARSTWARSLPLWGVPVTQEERSRRQVFDPGVVLWQCGDAFTAIDGQLSAIIARADLAGYYDDASLGQRHTGRQRGGGGGEPAQEPAPAYTMLPTGERHGRGERTQCRR